MPKATTRGKTTGRRVDKPPFQQATARDPKKPARNPPTAVSVEPAPSVSRQSGITSSSVILRIRRDDLDVVSSPVQSIAIGSNSTPPGRVHLNVLQGALGDFTHLEAGASWIENVAHGIFDPIERHGQIWTHSQGTTDQWVERDRDPSWQRITSADPLRAAVYEYVLEGSKVTVPRLIQINSRGSSATSKGEKSNSTAFRRKIEARDGSKCVISGKPIRQPAFFRASHIVPKRLREKIAKIADRYVHIPGVKIRTRFNPQTGILLYADVDIAFDHFFLGLYQPSVGNSKSFVAHYLDPSMASEGTTCVPNLTAVRYPSVPNWGASAAGLDTSSTPEVESSGTFGGTEAATGPLPSVQDGATTETGSSATLEGPESATKALPSLSQDDSLSSLSTITASQSEGPSVEDEVESDDSGDDDTESLDSSHVGEPAFPPSGLLLWHYVQCVLRVFATEEFRSLPDVDFTEVPTRYHADDDDDDDDDEEAPLATYPSERFELFVASQQLKSEVLHWQAGTTDGQNPS